MSIDLLRSVLLLHNSYYPEILQPSAYIIVNEGTVFAYAMHDGTLIIPGTNSLIDWTTHNLQIGLVTADGFSWTSLAQRVGEMRFALGFASYAHIVYQNLEGWNPKRIIGHSLGGGAAQILGLRFGVPTLTISAPRVRRSAERSIDETRILNLVFVGDPVTNVPPRYLSGWSHVGNVRTLPRLRLTDFIRHSAKSYYPAVQHQIEAGKLPATWQ